VEDWFCHALCGVFGDLLNNLCLHVRKKKRK
jgi:hypothetical protein